jgi:LuxR family maltose regulon positive regulatory protein
VGEISALRGLIAYFAGDGEGAISDCRQALELSHPELWIVRVLARMYLGAGLLLQGDVNGGHQAFYSGLEAEKEQSKPFKGAVLMGAGYFHWTTADLQGMEQAAQQSIALCQASEYRQILGHSRYHLGCVRYQQNDLSAAESLFTWVVERPYQNYGDCYVNSACGLAMTYQAQGQAAEARQVVETAIACLLETDNIGQMPMLLALQVEVALRQGDLSAASQWAARLDPVPSFAPMPWFLAPHLTLVKVWLAQNTPASQAKAAELLSQLQAYLADTHNTRVLIDTLALQALLADVSGDQAAAQNWLEKSLSLANSGGFLRVFVDLGPQMAALLSQMQPDQRLSEYIARILDAFPAQQTPTKAQIVDRRPTIDKLVEPLTHRELQVLELLREYLTNKEIAAQLVISPGTVKSHTIRIYQKLDVKGRHQAVERAIDLGILGPR